MVLRRMLRDQVVGDSETPSGDDVNTGRDVRRDLSRLVYQGVFKSADGAASGRFPGSQGSGHHLRGHSRRFWRSTQSSSVTSPPLSFPSTVGKTSSLPRGSPTSSFDSSDAGNFPPKIAEYNSRDHKMKDIGKQFQHGAILNNKEGGYDDINKVTDDGGFFMRKTFQHQKNDVVYRHATSNPKDQVWKDNRRGGNILHGAESSEYNSNLHHWNSKTDVSTGLRRRRLVGAPDFLQDRHHGTGSSNLYGYNTHRWHRRIPPSSVAQESSKSYPDISNNHGSSYPGQSVAYSTRPRPINDPASVYDAMQSGGPYGGVSGHSSTPSLSYSSLVPKSSNYTVPVSDVTPLPHAHRQHLHSLPLSSPPSLSPLPSTDSQRLYRDRAISPYSSSPLLSSSSLSSSLLSSNSSQIASSISSSPLAQPSSNNAQSQNLLKHLGLENYQLPSSSSSSSASSLSSSSLSSSSSSSFSNTFSEKLRRSGLQSLNLQIDPMSAPTADYPSSWNFTDDFFFNSTTGNDDNWLSLPFGLLDKNRTSADVGGGVIFGDELSTTSGPDGLEPVEYKYWTILLVIFPLLTVFGNILVCLSVVKEKSLKTVTNYFICSLAVADIMVAVMVMPFAVYMECFELGGEKLACTTHITLLKMLTYELGEENGEEEEEEEEKEEEEEEEEEEKEEEEEEELS
ncbi:D(2) dopamine receptor [Elysia marginata]|uniref:D(2) dopamine receptor n=1 Tax=Elysia marginata TaxID=1093978 RepID=A0AAV4EH78_9GAST|nr:D(2) dopamine receptor [Elysia marginata]